MKKHRKVGNTTSTNFFTSEFKLKSTQFPKQSRQRKINTTFSNFRHQLFQEEPKSQQRYASKDGRPIIQQLKFLTSKEDNFKLPQSITKRSLSKAKEQSRLKIETKNKQLLQQHYQEIVVRKEEEGKQAPLYHLVAAKRSKQLNMKNPLKQKLERSALQKFNEAILKENEENQNVVSQKNAESLYLLLKTARMNHLKHQNAKLHSMPSESEPEAHEFIKRDTENDEKRSKNSRRQSESHTESQNQTIKNKNIKEAIKSKQSLFKNLEQRSTNPPPQQYKKPDIPKPKTSISIPANELAQTQVIKFQKVVCDDMKKERFAESEQEESSDFGMQLNEQSKIDVNRKASANKQKEISAQNTLNIKHIPQEKPAPAQNLRKQSIKIPEKTYKTMQSDEQRVPTKNKINPQPKKPEPAKPRYQQSDLDNIPSCQAYEKPSNVRQVPAEKQARNSSQFISLNNNKIEKVLTPKHLDIKTAPKINPPPKLSNLPETKVSQNRPKQAVEAEQIEEISLGPDKRKQPDPPKSKKQIPQPPPPKQQQPKKQKKDENEGRKVEAVVQQKQKSQEENEEQQSQINEIEDELTYYIERIEDVGQYRINSKDVYNDRSIDKQLLQIHKVCAYYMAHQFLYLAQWTCNYLQSNNFLNNFYSLTTDDLAKLREDGVLEGEIQNLSQNIELSKKLLKKCYEECKPFLKKEQQILIMDGKTNYHIRCCATLIKEFKKVYELLQRAPKNAVMLQRCVYLIELYCVLKLLNGEELKEYEEFEEIEDPMQHIETHKKLLLSL